MKIIRVTLTPEEQQDFDPEQFFTKLKDAGFRFERETCPIKIAGPWDRITHPDGTVVYRQWQETLQ